MRAPLPVLSGFLLYLAVLQAHSAPLPEVPIPETLEILERTLEDAMSQLSRLPEPPYYLAYAITEQRSLSLVGSNGSFAGESRESDRMLDIDIRVGSMRLDNTHKIRDASWFSEPDRPKLWVPVVDDLDVLRRLILIDTDDAYRQALRQLIKVRANDVVKVEREDTSDDFSPAPPARHTRTLPEPTLDEARWRDLLREASTVYLGYPHIYNSNVEVSFAMTRRTLVNTDGARIQDGSNQYRFTTWATTTAPDGMRISLYDYAYVAAEADMPDHAQIERMARGVAERLVALRSAPLVEPYEGPAILRGRAAGVFFHEIFGHRIEGHRQKDEEEGQTFTSRVGQAVLPPFLSVYDDPTLERLTVRGQESGLNGHYLYDDEGVAAKRVLLVDRGILRNFLMSRSPVAGFPVSNGHGRRQAGDAPIARQGNLIVEAHETVGAVEMRRKLIAEIKRQKKPFGLIFDDISGGFTMTGRSTPNAFSVQPVTVWKVYPDGRPDELVRGVDLIGTPLTTFSRILAAGDDPAVFNGMCGAESGWVPVSASAPSLLIQQVEVQRQEKMNERPPLLPPPSAHALPE